MDWIRIFTDSTLWAGSVIESTCLSVRLFVDHPRGLDSWSVPEDWTRGASPRIGLVERPRGLDSWSVPAWSLKNKEWFRIGLVDCPRMEPSKQGGVPD